MQYPKAMLKTCVIGSGIDKICEPELFDISQPLEPWMFNQVKYKITRDTDKSINRIIDYFSLINLINQLRYFIMQK